ncbi:serine hydrolase [Spiroplasma sp. BIUS-1]|uniref:serine hydrolase domain-containing protein n=1 Tax=Spiroplasma sp. BIUS-1 TaxID=216964 RepID=UPI0013989205|nr:serine hydrolase domain-containing protein [Spiroplasma sp. BIUS-1]QHX36345.1 serine hydrolase [Spiroplasma sp. BIUS-1]
MNNFENTINKIKEIVDKKFFMGATLKINKDKQNIFSYNYGINDVEIKSEMNEDLIFRAYSMTKVITTVAFLILVDKKKVSLKDPLYKFFPEFKNMKVISKEDNTKVVDCEKEILMEHLLTMTSGFTYFGNRSLTQKLVTELLQKFKIKNNNTFMNYEDFMKELSNIPLEFEPGTSWRYGLSLDVIAAVIEKISNQSFRDFVNENIFVPLEMNDSDFYLKDKSREAKVYEWTLVDDKNHLKKVEDFDFLIQEINKVPNMPMGGAGLFTTVKDYSNFLDFLLDGKDRKGNQLLSKEVLLEMTKDQIKELRKNFIWTTNKDYSYGYGVRVRVENTLYPLTEVGEFGWDGLLGSTGLVDPKNKITMCLMLSSKPGHNKLIESEFFDALYKDLNILKK